MGVSAGREDPELDTVDVKAGDVVLFLGAALMHGATPWRSAEGTRRVFVLQYQARHAWERNRRLWHPHKL